MDIIIIIAPKQRHIKKNNVSRGDLWIVTGFSIGYADRLLCSAVAFRILQNRMNLWSFRRMPATVDTFGRSPIQSKSDRRSFLLLTPSSFFLPTSHLLIRLLDCIRTMYLVGFLFSPFGIKSAWALERFGLYCEEPFRIVSRLFGYSGPKVLHFAPRSFPCTMFFGSEWRKNAKIQLTF